MKEKFDNRKLSGKIKVTCKYDDGSVRIWDTTKEEVVEHIKDIVDEYAADGYILTLRQLHYQLVTKNWIINHISCYQKLSGILDDCRYSGVIDWSAIEDRGRIPYLPYWVNDVSDALNDSLNQYRINRQEGQKNAIELWTEKDALSGILRRSTEKYHIQLVVNKGYTSSSAIYNAYQRVLEAIRNEQKFIILYFGDHDPSGLDMIRDIRERLTLMLVNGVYQIPLEEVRYHLSVIQIGLTMEQIQKYKLPPNPTKITDSRAFKYIQKYGKTCWEVDALKPQILTQIVNFNIQDKMDTDMYLSQLEREGEDKKQLQGIIESL